MRCYISISALYIYLAILAVSCTDQQETTDICNNLLVTDNMWHRAIFVFEENTGTIFLDNIEIKKCSGIERGGDTETPVLIGADYNASYGRIIGHFIGLIDEVRISNTARKPSARPLSADDRTIGLWRFEAEKGQITYDSSPNNLHGELVGGKRIYHGHRGKAIEFDGNTYIIIPDHPDFSADTVSVEISFKTAHVNEKGDFSNILVSKYVNNKPHLSEFCANILGANKNGLSWTGNGSNGCYCPP